MLVSVPFLLPCGACGCCSCCCFEAGFWAPALQVVAAAGERGWEVEHGAAGGA